MSTPPPDGRGASTPATPPAPASSAASSASLACGADPETLLGQVAEGRSARRGEHQAACPHCTATLAEYERLWAPFDELAATPTTAPPGSVERALRAVREQAGPTGWGRVEDPEDPDGAFLVAARVVVAVAGHAARTSAGVRVALSALGELGELTELDRDATTDDPPAAAEGGDTGGGARAGVSAGVTGQSVAVELTVAAEYGHDLHALAAHLRDRVIDEVAAQTGLRVVEVDVAITDVFPARGR